MKRHNKLLGRLYIVEPTLESLIKECKTPKACAYKAGKEYSNFLKCCKLANNFELKNFVQIAGALGRDTILLTLPRDYVDEHITTPPQASHWYLVIPQKETFEMLYGFLGYQKGNQLGAFQCGVSLDLLKALRNELENIIKEAEQHEGE